MFNINNIIKFIRHKNIVRKNNAEEKKCHYNGYSGIMKNLNVFSFRRICQQPPLFFFTATGTKGFARLFESSSSL